jgi:hypothetical protein
LADAMKLCEVHFKSVTRKTNDLSSSREPAEGSAMIEAIYNARLPARIGRTGFAPSLKPSLMLAMTFTISY